MALRRGGLLRRLLTHPLARDPVDDPARTTQRRRAILQSNAFLRKLYREWYRMIAAALPPVAGEVLELGSGPGFLREVIADAITSDVFPSENCDLVIDAHALPYGDATLRAIVMTNVFHHLTEPARFLIEAARCLQPGGRLITVEPWVTPWSRFVYGRFHHEPFDPAAPWGLDPGHPLAQANDALAWVVFARDADRFREEFPNLRVLCIRPMMPLVYILSGGTSLRPLMPAWSYGIWRCVEACARPFARCTALFALIVCEKRTD